MPDALAAIDDLSLEYAPGPDGRYRYVFVNSNNRNKSIKANIRTIGSTNFNVTTPDLSRQRPFFPQEFEVRIPPGGRTFIGRDRIFQRLRAEPDNDSERERLCNYSIAGAVYWSDEPTPVPEPGAVGSSIYAYSCPSGPGKVAQFAVNLNHLWTIEFHLEMAESGIRHGTALNPFQQVALGSWDGNKIWHFKGEAKFTLFVP